MVTPWTPCDTQQLIEEQLENILRRFAIRIDFSLCQTNCERRVFCSHKARTSHKASESCGAMKICRLFRTKSL